MTTSTARWPQHDIHRSKWPGTKAVKQTHPLLGLLLQVELLLLRVGLLLGLPPALCCHLGLRRRGRSLCCRRLPLLPQRRLLLRPLPAQPAQRGAVLQLLLLLPLAQGCGIIRAVADSCRRGACVCGIVA